MQCGDEPACGGRHHQAPQEDRHPRVLGQAGDPHRESRCGRKLGPGPTLGTLQILDACSANFQFQTDASLQRCVHKPDPLDQARDAYWWWFVLCF